jgi:hypothetical protein
MKSCINTKTASLFLFFIFFQQVSAIENGGAVTSSLAGAGRASIDVVDGPSSNPASTAAMRGFFFSSSVSSYKEKSDLQQDLQVQQFQVNLIDATDDNWLPAAIKYSKKTSSLEKEVSGQSQMELSLASRLAEKMYFGIGGYLQKTDIYESANYSQTNLRLGGIYAISDNWGVGFVAENILTDTSKVPEQMRQSPLYALGSAMVFESIFRLRMDIENSNAANTYRVGLEHYLNSFLNLRMGAAASPELSKEEWGAGFGFHGPKFGVHYGYLSSKTPSQLVTRHSVDLVIPF